MFRQIVADKQRQHVLAKLVGMTTVECAVKALTLLRLHIALPVRSGIYPEYSLAKLVNTRGEQQYRL